jgi:hypothetical protein
MVDRQLVIEEIIIIVIIIIITLGGGNFTPLGSGSFLVGLGEGRTVSNVPELPELSHEV